MRAEIRVIEPPTDDLSWDSFEHPSRTGRVSDDYGEFVLTIGAEGERGTNLFFARVSTPAAASRARRGRYFHGFIVERFEPEIIRKALKDFVSSIESDTWQGIVDQLRCRMKWEYDGMEPIK